MAVVVFPTPPFWLAMQMTFAMESGVTQNCFFEKNPKI
jgi:hypothetical protein